MKGPQRAVECDVLVIGGGGAGLTAAIEARQRGASVLVACKGRAGRSGNTVVAASMFSAVVSGDGVEDSPEQHFQDTLVGGKGINEERLVRILASGGGSRLLRLEEWGVELLRSDGELVRKWVPGHTRPRGIPVDNSRLPVAVGGLTITLPLRATAERMGVRFLDDSPVIQLLLRDGEVCGALVVCLEEGELLQIKARSVVMAAGGAGRLYASTNNTRGICGDGYGLMLEAGAGLRDMEFVQFYPCQIFRPVVSPMLNSLFFEGAVLRNRHGERFMPLYDPVNEDRATRDVQAQAIFREVQRGNGVEGGVYVDCTAVPEAALQQRYFALTRDLRRQGVDLNRDWVRVEPTVHFVMGGAAIDERCGTNVPGLFAAGEAAGGVHGANRLGGNALTEAVVFGALAGQMAAKHATDRKALPDPIPSSLLLEPAGGNESVDSLRQELRRAMWGGASIVRSETTLRSTLATVRECAAAVGRCRAASLSDLARREETRLMCLTAEAIVLSALPRRESRGAHYREDFPTGEDRWLGSHQVRMVDGGMRVQFTPKQP